MNGPPQFSENTRQIVHMAMGGFALLLRYVPSWMAAILAAAVLGYNILVLPRLGGRRLYRPSVVLRGFPPGILLYPASVLLLILLFPSRLDIAAAAWGILAFGDGAATVIGRRFGTIRIPWNTDKTLAGTAAFVVCGGAAGAFLAWWCSPTILPPTYAWYPFVAPVLAAAIAALVETVPVRLDDNIRVPFSAAGVLWILSLVSEDLLPSRIAPIFFIAIAFNAAAAWAGFRARTVSRSGAIAGMIIGVIIFLGAGWRGWALLFAAFAVATLTSRLGLARKSVLGIAEERGGRRGAGNAIANTAVAAAAALVASLSYAHDAGMLAFVAALTAGGSDTVASEIGKAWGRRTYLITRWREVRPGTPGGVSLEGTAAGVAGAFALAGAGAALQLVPAAAVVLVVIAATIGSLAESVMAATLEARGIVNNDVLNFLNTAIAAFVVVVIAGAAG